MNVLRAAINSSRESVRIQMMGQKDYGQRLQTTYGMNIHTAS
jgi:hypothetical protein